MNTVGSVSHSFIESAKRFFSPKVIGIVAIAVVAIAALGVLLYRHFHSQRTLADGGRRITPPPAVGTPVLPVTLPDVDLLDDLLANPISYPDRGIPMGLNGHIPNIVKEFAQSLGQFDLSVTRVECRLIDSNTFEVSTADVTYRLKTTVQIVEENVSTSQFRADQFFYPIPPQLHTKANKPASPGITFLAATGFGYDDLGEGRVMIYSGINGNPSHPSSEWVYVREIEKRNDSTRYDLKNFGIIHTDQIKSFTPNTAQGPDSGVRGFGMSLGTGTVFARCEETGSWYVSNEDRDLSFRVFPSVIIVSEERRSDSALPAEQRDSSSNGRYLKFGRWPSAVGLDLSFDNNDPDRIIAYRLDEQHGFNLIANSDIPNKEPKSSYILYRNKEV